jgi:hypothetical protein
MFDTVTALVKRETLRLFAQPEEIGFFNRYFL